MINFLFFGFSALRSKNTQLCSLHYTPSSFFTQALKNKKIFASKVKGFA
jgi:hypothetical protein